MGARQSERQWKGKPRKSWGMQESIQYEVGMGGLRLSTEPLDSRICGEQGTGLRDCWLPSGRCACAVGQNWGTLPWDMQENVQTRGDRDDRSAGVDARQAACHCARARCPFQHTMHLRNWRPAASSTLQAPGGPGKQLRPSDSRTAAHAQPLFRERPRLGQGGGLNLRQKSQ